MEKPTKVIPIDPDGKYAICIRERRLDTLEITRLKKQLDHWWASDDKFVILDYGLEFVRITEPKEAENAILQDEL